MVVLKPWLAYIEISHKHLVIDVSSFYNSYVFARRPFVHSSCLRIHPSPFHNPFWLHLVGKLFHHLHSNHSNAYIHTLEWWWLHRLTQPSTDAGLHSRLSLASAGKAVQMRELIIQLKIQGIAMSTVSCKQVRRLFITGSSAQLPGCKLAMYVNSRLWKLKTEFCVFFWKYKKK